MNRRTFIASTATSLTALMAANTDALARMQYMSTPTPANTSLDIDEYSPIESLYLGVLFTWLELLDDTLDDLQEAIAHMEDESYSDRAKAAMLLPLGLWRKVARDTTKFGAPELFELAHVHTVAAFGHLGAAAEIFVSGVIEENAPAITLGTELINMASEEIGLMIDALPFSRPNREKLLPKA